MTTQRFGLNQFDSPSDGAISDDGYKFTGRDRRTIDRILAALENHNHTGGERLEEPDFAPQLTLIEEGGELPAGVTFHYRVSYVDQYGLETAAGPEASIEMPDVIEIPNAPMLEALEGGQLDEGVYYYALTAVDDDGNETPMGPANIITISDRRSVQISLVDGAPEGAEELHIWRQAPADSDFTRIASMDAVDTATYLDDGTIESDPCPCDPFKLPPLDNETRGTNVVHIEIPSGEVEEGTLVQRWRIYRSTESGVYPPGSMVAEVVESSEEQGEDLVNEFFDQGDDLLPGQPLERTQTLHPSRHVTLPAGDELPDPEGLPEYYPFVLDGVLHYLVEGEFVEIAGGGGDALPEVDEPLVVTAHYGSNSSAVRVVNLASGKLAWEREYPEDVWVDGVDGNARRVVVHLTDYGDYEAVEHLRAVDGELIWRGPSELAQVYDVHYDGRSERGAYRPFGEDEAWVLDAHGRTIVQAYQPDGSDAVHFVRMSPQGNAVVCHRDGPDTSDTTESVVSLITDTLQEIRSFSQTNRNIVGAVAHRAGLYLASYGQFDGPERLDVWRLGWPGFTELYHYSDDTLTTGEEGDVLPVVSRDGRFCALVGSGTGSALLLLQPDGSLAFDSGPSEMFPLHIDDDAEVIHCYDTNDEHLRAFDFTGSEDEEYYDDPDVFPWEGRELTRVLAPAEYPAGP